MTLDEKASIFCALFSMEECISLAHKSFLSPHMYANQASYANGAGRERRGALKPAVPSASNQLFTTHTRAHLNPRVNGNAAAVPQSAARSPRRTGDDRHGCCQTLRYAVVSGVRSTPHSGTIVAPWPWTSCVMLSCLLQHGCLRLLVRDLAGRRHHLLSRFRATAPLNPSSTSVFLSLVCARHGILRGDSVLQPQSAKLSEYVCADSCVVLCQSA